MLRTLSSPSSSSTDMMIPESYVSVAPEAVLHNVENCDAVTNYGLRWSGGVRYRDELG